MTDPQLPHRNAVLLINLGSPDAPNRAALRRYLAEFLSDKRVIDLPRWQWLPILHGIVLNVRPQKSAALYRAIWRDEGAPLIAITREQVAALAANLTRLGQGRLTVDYAMRYGNPSIYSVLQRLQNQGVQQLLVIPMYPQYAGVTTGSVIDGFAEALKRMRYMPEWRFIHHWHDHPRYITALATQFHHHVEQFGAPELLLHSYHGLPQRHVSEGDPYWYFCKETTQLFSAAVDFPTERIKVVFQSRFGYEEWLKPYADKTLAALPGEGVKHVAVMCPGFAADCLETLEEMAMTNRKNFLSSGGDVYHYISALNADPAHIVLLSELVVAHTRDWPQWQANLEVD